MIRRGRIVVIKKGRAVVIRKGREGIIGGRHVNVVLQVIGITNINVLHSRICFPVEEVLSGTARIDQT